MEFALVGDGFRVAVRRHDCVKRKLEDELVIF